MTAHCRDCCGCGCEPVTHNRVNTPRLREIRRCASPRTRWNMRQHVLHDYNTMCVVKTVFHLSALGMFKILKRTVPFRRIRIHHADGREWVHELSLSLHVWPTRWSTFQERERYKTWDNTTSTLRLLLTNLTCSKSSIFAEVTIEIKTDTARQPIKTWPTC